MLKIIATGRVGRDGELRTTPNGNTVLNFPVAAESGFGDHKVTTWLRCSVWNKRAEALEPYITKGIKVAVTGTGSLREWENNGKSGKDVELNIDEIDFMSSSEEAGAASPKPQAESTTEFKDRLQAVTPASLKVPPSPAPSPGGPADDDDIPF
jgi:single-strand DNA-binding protein